MPHPLVYWLRRWLWAELSPPVFEAAEGQIYRFRWYPDDGVLFRYTDRRLVNLSYPGDDLVILDDGSVTTPEGVCVGHVADLVRETFD